MEELRTADPSNVQGPVKQNASPGEQSKAPRPRWKPGQEQNPRPENQDSQHMLEQPRGYFPDFRIFSIGFFPFSPGLLCNIIRKRPQNVEKIARFPGGEKSLESCHVCGCHGFFGSRQNEFPEIPCVGLFLLGCRKWGSKRGGFKQIGGYLRKLRPFSSVFWVFQLLFGPSGKERERQKKGEKGRFRLIFRKGG